MQKGRASLLRGGAARFPPPAVVALGVAAFGLPVWVAIVPGGLGLLAAPRTGIVLATALAAAPALAVLAAVLRGFDRVRRRLIAPPNGDHRQAIARILLAAAMLAYAIGLGIAMPAGAAIARCVMIAALGLACAWLFLLQIILNPGPSAIRRLVAIGVDVGLVSAFLHAGDFLTAAWYPAYLYLAIRYGIDGAAHVRRLALLAGTAGFAVVVATTAFWQVQPLLSLGSIAAVVLVPAYVSSLLRGLARAAAAAAAEGAAKARLFAGLGDGLRDSLKAILRAGAKLDRTGLTPEEGEIIARMRLSARAALVQIDEIPTYAAIEAGSFAPETRSFDLYQLIHGAVAALRPQAADRGIALGVRIDPRLPYELRGWPHQLRQLLICLVAGAMRGSERTAIQVHLDLAEFAGDAVRLRLTVRDQGTRVARAAAASARDPVFAVAERLAGAMGGRLSVAGTPRKGLELAAELPFAIDRATAALLLDLDGLPVLIATEDAGFAGELGAALTSWRAEPRWIGAAEPAFAHVEALVPEAQRPVLIVDGRDEILAALSWAHRAIRTNPAAAPYVLFVAAESRIDSVIGLADGELDAILPAPFTPGILQSTLHALRVGTADWFPAELAPPPVPLLAPDPAPGARAEPPPARAEADPPVPLPVPSPRRAVPEPAAPGPPQILVAAVNAMNRKIIEQILIGARYVPHLVADAEQALDVLEARPIDLLLLDLAGAASEDAAAAERCREARLGLPIIVLSGDPEAEAVLAAAGVDAVLSKPLEPSRLLAAIRAAVPRPPAMPAPPAAAESPPSAEAIVTEISSHPRFGRSSPALIDRRAVDALWSLGGGSAFFQDVIEAFRADARQLLKEIGGAAAIGDIGGFTAAIQALRNCTASFGGAHLREMLLSMQQVSARELRDKGAAYVQELNAEVARLDEILGDYRKTAE